MMSRRSLSSLATLVAVVALAGCGTNDTLSGPGSPVDSAPPSAPTNIRSEIRGDVSVLLWDESPDADVAGYDVHMYQPDPAREAAYVRVNSTTITGNEFDVSTGASEDTWYRVKSVDQAGNRSSASGAAYVAGELAEPPIATGGPGETTDEVPVVR